MNFNKEPFDESTKLKLEIFGECFREWLPVFLHDKYTNQIAIFDFFAGSGSDSNGVHGSPLILLKEAKGENRKYCSKIDKDKVINFIFSEKALHMSKELRSNVEKYKSECINANQCGDCVYKISVEQKDFKSAFNDPETQTVLKDKNIGKFILLDQYGFSQIDKDIFLQLVNSPRTDFIFFISSSYVKRFKEHPNTKQYINTESMNFDQMQPKECHRVIADYYRSLIPPEKEYYLHHFTIQKETCKGNYYGLIFGSNHTFGMEKFLKVCWRNDNFSGEANFNMYNDFEEGNLFHVKNSSNKKYKVISELRKSILSGLIVDNISGFKYTMRMGCEPKLFTQVVRELEEEGLIKRAGTLNYSSTNIHNAKRYYFEVCNNANDKN
ncbi:three-Cys-motif partner protein TcmP [bacterium]|nr:three-Cys-motif partner protein TcmP [bacterium]